MKLDDSATGEKLHEIMYVSEISALPGGSSLWTSTSGEGKDADPGTGIAGGLVTAGGGPSLAAGIGVSGLQGDPRCWGCFDPVFTSSLKNRGLTPECEWRDCEGRSAMGLGVYPHVPSWSWFSHSSSLTRVRLSLPSVF